MTTYADAPVLGGPTVIREPGKPAIMTIPRQDSAEAAADWLIEHRAAVQSELHRSGAVMLRGLPVRDAVSFATVRDALIDRRAGYKEKATPRTDFGEGVFSSTDLPAAQPIRLHNENSYTLDFPGLLLFGCVTAPAKGGGATTTGDMREALRLLPDGLRARFEKAGWLLVRNYSELAGLPWYTTFATDDKAVAEAYCDENTIGYEWLDDDSLVTRQRRSAIVTHPVTGERVWFNHFAFWNSRTLDPDVREVLEETYGRDGLPFNTYLGDGTRLTDEEVDAVNAVYDRVTVREDWQVGDLLLVDNILCAHGRESFTGDRKILVAMGEPVALADCSPATQPSTTVHGE